MKQLDDTAPRRGMDIDEIRYQRALSLARYEMAKYHLVESVNSVTDKFTKPPGIVGKLIGSLNYMDYAMLAFKFGSKLIKWRKKRG